MADLTALADIDHTWGGDVSLSGTGGLARAVRLTRSRQRVLRRLLTNPGDYIQHPDYGAGLPRFVGENADPRAVAALVRRQMRLEPSVAQTPAPVVSVSADQNTLSLSIQYVALPDRQPAALVFSVTA